MTGDLLLQGWAPGKASMGIPRTQNPGGPCLCLAELEQQTHHQGLHFERLFCAEFSGKRVRSHFFLEAVHGG